MTLNYNDIEIQKNCPLVTVIVGMYCGEKYIEECIDSILRQTYQNLEVVLVDDGSPDGCGAIADWYATKDKRVTVIHQANSGVSVSRNIAIERSKGEYVCIVDQDDILSDDYIEYYYKLIIKNDADISYTPSVDKFWGAIHKTADDKDVCSVIGGDEAAERMLYHKIVIAPWNKMIKRTLIEANNIRFNPKFFCGEGFAFSVQCFQAAKRVAVGNRKVYHYRVGDPESGASKFRLSTINSSIQAQQYIKETLLRPTKKLLAAWEFSNWHTHCDCLNIMVGCGVEKEYREEYIKIKRVCKSKARCALKAPVSAQQRLRGILFMINPHMAAKIINRFRVRKFAGGGTLS